MLLSRLRIENEITAELNKAARKPSALPVIGPRQRTKPRRHAVEPCPQAISGQIANVGAFHSRDISERVRYKNETSGPLY